MNYDLFLFIILISYAYLSLLFLYIISSFAYLHFLLSVHRLPRIHRLQAFRTRLLLPTRNPFPQKPQPQLLLSTIQNSHQKVYRVRYLPRWVNVFIILLCICVCAVSMQVSVERSVGI